MTQAQFDLIEREIAPFRLGNRTLSAAQLAWFLDRVWRIEPEDVADAICDSGGDKGIDALVVDDDLKEITVFQSKHYETAGRTQGDRDLRDQVGTAAHFVSPEAVDRLLASHPSRELAQLVTRLDVRNKVADGAHATRLVFVTNGRLDRNGAPYAATAAQMQPPLEVWGRAELSAVADRTRRPELRNDTVSLTSIAPPIVLDLDASTRMAIAVVPAQELALLPGIDDLTIFSRNVRLSLKRTRINMDIADTILDASEHARFPAFHNGLTILTTAIGVVGNCLELNGIGVVNGCQSLVVLKQQNSHLTAGLYVVVRAVQVDPTSNLADDITYRTNNQNPVDIRDQRSTDAIQRDLQAQVAGHYGTELFYAIRAGEDPGTCALLENKLAAQLIMAVYLGEPWNAVRKVRLFDEDYHRIFRRDVDAHRLRLLYELAAAIDAARTGLRVDLAASFASVRFTIAYLAAKVVAETGEGQALLADPSRWFPHLVTEVRTVLDVIAADVVESLNFYIEGIQAEYADRDEVYDPKTAFKSAVGVRAVENDVVRSARRRARGDRSILFEVPPAR